MYIYKNNTYDPCCGFCWYCIHDKYGEPVRCEKMNIGFYGCIGYCDDLK